MLPDQNQVDQFKFELISIVGLSNLVSDPAIITEKLENTLGIKRFSPFIVYPLTVVHVQQIVFLANRFGVSLYPLSRGYNIGYGEWAPVENGQVIVCLERMNQILEFDQELGEIEIQPGVSQQQISDYLKKMDSDWIADMTGAPPQASVLGNILEAGFGHSPLGNHREHILELEVVLGNGHQFRTGRFPDLGPNLSSLFIQSNYGIVTSVRLPLLKRNTHTLSYTVQFKNDKTFVQSITKLRELRQLGLLPSLIHIANSTRVMMSTQKFPQDVSEDTVLSENDCLKRLKIPLMPTSAWMGVGSLYGTKGQIKQAKKEIASSLRGQARVSFYSQRKIKILKIIARVFKLFSTSEYNKVKAGIESLESLQGLSLGEPSSKPNNNILWRCKEQRDLGLLWISPVVLAKKESIEKLLNLLRPIFSRHRFEMPMTLTYMDHAHFVCVLNISFNKNNTQECKRAYDAYHSISLALLDGGFKLYRKGIQSHLYSISKDRKTAIRQLKNAWDPKAIIAPGRYDI